MADDSCRTVETASFGQFRRSLRAKRTITTIPGTRVLEFTSHMALFLSQAAGTRQFDNAHGLPNKEVSDQLIVRLGDTSSSSLPTDINSWLVISPQAPIVPLDCGLRIAECEPLRRLRAKTDAHAGRPSAAPFVFTSPFPLSAHSRPGSQLQEPT